MAMSDSGSDSGGGGQLGRGMGERGSWGGGGELTVVVRGIAALQVAGRGWTSWLAAQRSRATVDAATSLLLARKREKEQLGWGSRLDKWQPWQ